MLTKLIRRKDAPAFLKVEKKYFKENIERCLTKIVLKDEGVFFERLELSLNRDKQNFTADGKLNLPS